MSYPNPQKKWQKTDHNFDSRNGTGQIRDHDQIPDEPNIHQAPSSPRRPPLYIALTGVILLIVLLLAVWGLVVYAP